MRSSADIVRELLHVHVHVHVHDYGDVVAVELVIHATFKGPMSTSLGTIEHPGAQIDVPCADSWYLRAGKIERFNCYFEIPVLIDQVHAATGAATVA